MIRLLVIILIITVLIYLIRRIGTFNIPDLKEVQAFNIISSGKNIYRYSISGTAQNIVHRTNKQWSTLMLKLTYASDHNEVPIHDINVRLIGYQLIGSKIDENDEIKINTTKITANRAHKKEINLTSRCVLNITTGEMIKTGHYYQGEIINIQQVQGRSVTKKINSASHPALKKTSITKSESEEILRFNIKLLDYGESKVLFAEMKGKRLHGYINNGDIVAVFAKQKPGKPLKPYLVKNLTTNVDVKTYNKMGFVDRF